MLDVLRNDADDDGQLVITPAATFADAGALETPSVFGIRLEDTGNSKAVSASLRAALGDALDVHDEVAFNRDDVTDVTNEVRPVLFGLNALLVLIAVVNVITTLLFAVRERYRDIGILKATGWTPRQVMASVAVGASMLAVVATVVGVPLGLWLTETLFNYFGADEGWQPGLAVTPAAWQLALLLPAGLLLAAIGAWLPARQAARLTVTDALRYE